MTVLKEDQKLKNMEIWQQTNKKKKQGHAEGVLNKWNEIPSSTSEK